MRDDVRLVRGPRVGRGWGGGPRDVPASAALAVREPNFPVFGAGAEGVCKRTNMAGPAAPAEVAIRATSSSWDPPPKKPPGLRLSRAGSPAPALLLARS